MKKPSYQSRDEQFILQLRQLVIANLKNEQFGVERLSSDIGLSRSQLYRKLKHIRGQTISQFIREVRLQEALQLLKIESNTTAAIAYAVGFGSPAYFHKCFIEQYGMTPGELRRQLRDGHDLGTLISPPEQDDAEEAAPDIHTAPVPIAGWGPKGMRRAILLLLLVTVLLLVISFFPNAVISKREARPTVAVLPVNYRTASEEIGHLALDLYEKLNMEVARTGELRVLSRVSTQSFTRRNMLLPEVAEALSVDVAIESSLLLTADSIAIKLHLIRAAPVEQQWWAKEYLLIRGKAQAALEPIVQEVIREIRRELLPR